MCVREGGALNESSTDHLYDFKLNTSSSSGPSAVDDHYLLSDQL